MGGGGTASPVACPYLKSALCCPLPQAAALWGWRWAKGEGQGRQGARCPAGISPAALSEIAWINKHESCWEMRGSGQGQHSPYPLCNSAGGRAGKREGPGAAYPKIWMGGRVTGLGLSWCHPEPQGWARWQGRTAVSRMGSAAAAGAVGCGQAPELPPCLVPEAFRQGCCPGCSSPWPVP